MNENQNQAIKAFNGGGIVIFPTDTAYGIGCRFDISASVDRLFEIRKRPLTQPMPLLVDSIRMALKYYDAVSLKMETLMQKYWPGALTIISKAKIENIYRPVLGGGSSVGIRMPNHQELLEIISVLGVPILGPSANFHGLPTPFEFSELDPEIIKLVDFVLPGECSVKQASTVVDCQNDKLLIVRQGGVDVQV
jgi:L-threonylcarbamoyladenylate synthase